MNWASPAFVTAVSAAIVAVAGAVTTLIAQIQHARNPDAHTDQANGATGGAAGHD